MTEPIGSNYCPRCMEFRHLPCPKCEVSQEVRVSEYGACCHEPKCQASWDACALVIQHPHMTGTGTSSWANCPLCQGRGSPLPGDQTWVPYESLSIYEDALTALEDIYLLMGGNRDGDHTGCTPEDCHWRRAKDALVSLNRKVEA